MSSTPSPVEALVRQGWISLTFWITFGLLLEGFIGFRTPALLDDPVRRDLFRLAHAHGTLLSIVLVAAALCARLNLIRLGRMASLGLRSAALVVPGGFFLGGLGHFKDEPGLGIILAPIGALLLLGSAVHLARSASSAIKG